MENKNKTAQVIAVISMDSNGELFLSTMESINPERMEQLINIIGNSIKNKKIKTTSIPISLVSNPKSELPN